jgi:thiamine kinase-like enzyme
MFYKNIVKNSNEYNILKHVIQNLPPCEKKYFVPIQSEKSISKKHFQIGFEKKSKPLSNVSKSVLYSSQCILSVFDALDILYKYQILHCDVHLDNILYDARRKTFHLIDFDISRKVDSLDVVTFSLYQWKEDKFQFIWNIVTNSAPFPVDFSKFRLTCQKMKLNDYAKLQKIFLKSIFFHKKDEKIAQKFLDFFRTKDTEFPFRMTKRNKIITKCILLRFLLLYKIKSHKEKDFIYNIINI